MFRSIGQVMYSPRSHLGSSEQWVILGCDDEIGKYYRSLYQQEHPYLNGNTSGKLLRPVFGSHISFVRNEKLINPKLWRLDEGQVVEFEYEASAVDNGTYYWLRVSCPFLLDLRQRLGLARQPRFNLHLTIGRTVG